MSQMVVVSDMLYQRLESEVQRRGLTGVEELLELWTASEHGEQQRHETVHGIRTFRERMQTQYGQAPDSVELVRTDRMR